MGDLRDGDVNDPARVVTDFLSALQARQIERAESLMTAGAVMVFPGTAPMTSLTELVDWAKPRYRSIEKTIEAVETYSTANGATVYVRGTLAGTWPDGQPFRGIRFIDRFEVLEGRISRQDVWNDLAEVRGR